MVPYPTEDQTVNIDFTLPNSFTAQFRKSSENPQLEHQVKSVMQELKIQELKSPGHLSGIN